MDTNVSYSSKNNKLFYGPSKLLVTFSWLFSYQLLVTSFLIIREKLYRFETQTCNFSICSSHKKIIEENIESKRENICTDIT